MSLRPKLDLVALILLILLLLGRISLEERICSGRHENEQRD